MPRKTIADLLDESRSRLDRLEPTQALEAQSAGALLIDTRSGDERRQTGVIPGSIHIPRSVLEWRLDPDADPAFHSPHVHGLDQLLVLVCAHGYSTSLAAATLQELGFAQATDLIGGFAAWKEAGLPVRPAPAVEPDAVPGMGGPVS
jgi:rhodanese-related sulfurtransferase